MTGLDDWRQVWPRATRPTPAVEVEFFGGPRDGERRFVGDVDAPVEFFQFRSQRGAIYFEEKHAPEADLEELIAPEAHVYRRRPLDLDEDEKRPVLFDYMPSVPA